MSTPKQPAPVANERPHIADLVIDDIRARKAAGMVKYGTPLQAGNGRNAIQDAYEEALDLAQYLKQAIEERSRWAADAIASHERIFGSNREPEVKCEPDTQVPIVEVANEAGEAIHEAHSDQADTRSDESGRGISEVQAQAHRSSLVAISEREDALRREGAVAALRWLRWSACWRYSSDGRPMIELWIERVESGEVTPWAKK